MRYLPIIAVLGGLLAGGSAAAQSTTPPANTPPAAPAPVSPIIWLDGYYSAHAGLTEFPANWSHTLSQGLGGTCAIDVNASRTVLDVIAQLHREYGGAGSGH
jgi:hypothetical protein